MSSKELEKLMYIYGFIGLDTCTYSTRNLNKVLYHKNNDFLIYKGTSNEYMITKIGGYGERDENQILSVEILDKWMKK